MYYLLLLDWKRCHLHAIDCLVKRSLWDKKHNRALVMLAWDFVCQPKDKGGLGILDFCSHIMARRTTFLMRITSSYKPLWTYTFWRFIENAVVYFKGRWNLDVWNKFFSHAPLQTTSSTLHVLLQSFKQIASGHTLEMEREATLRGELICVIISVLVLLNMWRILVGHFTLGAFFSKHGLKGV
ncbi:hypothetical protein KP509_02G090900 [Ceratopteris richardii]|uniref:Uncharacterized protein n=1 Tax=Ceratopteris richardii TaxID=49495 RepID=A0A8T2VGQ7_CERRI|nr:hypothetical protein KP509_02G090900 [Ceratopteris richardii]